MLCRDCQASGDDSTSCSAGLLRSIWATRPACKIRLAVKAQQQHHEARWIACQPQAKRKVVCMAVPGATQCSLYISMADKEQW